LYKLFKTIYKNKLKVKKSKIKQKLKTKNPKFKNEKFKNEKFKRASGQPPFCIKGQRVGPKLSSNLLALTR
jgi:hypothetical protein